MDALAQYSISSHVASSHLGSKIEDRHALELEGLPRARRAAVGGRGLFASAASRIRYIRGLCESDLDDPRNIGWTIEL